MRSSRCLKTGAIAPIISVLFVNRLSKSYIWGALLLLWMGVIFSLSQQPGSGSYWEPPLWYVVERKSAHVFEYAVLMFISVQFFRSWYPQESVKRVLFLAFVLCVTYGFLDEVHQFFIFGRGARVTDVIIDACGALLVAGAFGWYERYRRHV